MAITKKESVKRINLREFQDYSDATVTEKKKIKTEVGLFVVDQINDFLDRSTSPVSGGQFKKKRKDKKPSKLFEDGDMRSQITFAEFKDGVDVGIFSNAPLVEKLKAFNHNVGDTLPRRQFVPDKKQKFKRKINTGIKKIIEKLSKDAA